MDIDTVRPWPICSHPGPQDMREARTHGFSPLRVKEAARGLRAFAELTLTTPKHSTPLPSHTTGTTSSKKWRNQRPCWAAPVLGTGSSRRGAPHPPRKTMRGRDKKPEVRATDRTRATASALPSCSGCTFASCSASLSSTSRTCGSGTRSRTAGRLTCKHTVRSPYSPPPLNPPPPTKTHY